MIRKTKKGPRRASNMPVVSNQVAVQTTYAGCRYITAGKVYKRVEPSRWSFGIIDDTGSEICIRYPGDPCGHLNHEGAWHYVRAYK